MKGKSFPETNWSYIGTLTAGDEGDRTRVLRYLAQSYWAPIYLFLRRSGLDENEAQDSVQDFFAYALETNLFAKAEEQKGRFRSFLLTSLKRHVGHRVRAASTAKRSPNDPISSLDTGMPEGFEAADSEIHSPEAEFHRAWVRQLLAETYKRLRLEYCSSGKETHFRLFSVWVYEPAMSGEEPPALKDLAYTQGLDPKEASNRIQTAKRAFKRLLIGAISEYAVSETDRDMELIDVLKGISL